MHYSYLREARKVDEILLYLQMVGNYYVDAEDETQVFQKSRCTEKVACLLPGYTDS